MTRVDVPRIIGHRGARANAPENTLAGLRAAHAEGARWVEFDVKLTRDGVPILMHDETLDRTTNGSGRVRDVDAAEIARLDAGAWFDRRFAGESVPTLAATLALLASLDMGFNLEVKPCPGREVETTAAALAVLRRAWPQRHAAPIISSFKAPSLRAAREIAPDLPRGYLAERLADDWLDQARALDCSAIHPGTRHLAREQVMAIKRAGYPILVWTVNDAARARELVGWGVDSLITDAPAAVAGGLRDA
jgi:glycerophosphoryl diester phosphodiesterase